MVDSVDKIAIADPKVWKILGTYEMALSLKKKGFFGSSELDQTKIRLNDLSGKCISEKKVKLGKFNIIIKLRVRQPFRNPEMEEIPVNKSRVDSYPQPFRQLGEGTEIQALVVPNQLA